MDYVWILVVATVVMLLLFIAAANTTEVKASKASERARLAEFERAGMQIHRPFLRAAVISGHHIGVRFEHYIVPAGKNTPARTVVSIPTTAPGEFHVHPETGGTEVFKQLGMVDEFQTGDASFDRKFYFSGTTDEYVRVVFGFRENLERVRALFAGGFDELEKSETHLTASKPGGGLIGIAELKGIVEQLTAFRLPPSVPGEVPKIVVAKWAWYALLAAMAVITVIGGVAISIFVTKRPLLSDGWIDFTVGVLPAVGALYVAILVAAYIGLKGRSMAARGMAVLLGGLPILAIPLVGILALANERFDSTEAKEHEVRLVKHYTTSGRKSTHHYLEFESWRGRNRERLAVSVDTYALAREGQVWQVRMRRGWLGQPWVESIGPRT